jgi:HK97 family phage major capsid protein
MSENVYLKSLQDQYETLQKSMNGLQHRATEAKRDLTNEEMRSLVEMGERSEVLYTQIKDLSEIEVRNAQVAAMADRVYSAAKATPSTDGDAQPSGDGDNTQFRALGVTTKDRDPGIYTRGGEHSFLADQFRAAKMNDRSARDRLTSHSQALQDNEHLRDVLGAGASTFGAGLVPPVWLAELFAPVLHRRLRVASMLRQVPWAGPFAWTIPVAGTVAKTSSVAEGVNTTETNPEYTTVTVTPKAIMGYSEVSRQMLEASNPAVDAVIWGDLLGDFYDNAELEVISAINGQSGSNAVTVSAGVLTTTDIALQRAGILAGIAAIADAPAGDADLFVGNTNRWVTYLKFADTTGRPLVLAQAYNPQNAIGSGDIRQAFGNAVQGTLENLLSVTSPSVGASTGFIVNSQELLFSLSPPMQFRFDEPAGPALVRIGVWGYEAVSTGRRPKAISKITYSGS